ncbi:MAG: ISNCY family transposase [Gammaproteobacteria bacterium]|nr:ISNCY family transposase [Gammaproteobacteria bacterium]
MVFEDAYSMWTERRLTQEEAAELLGAGARTFRRWTERYGEDGVEGLRDRRVSRASQRAAPVDEVMAMVSEYETRHAGWNVRHYYGFYREGGGTRSYNWVRSKLQAHGKVARGKGRGKHRKRREPSPLPGMLLHQDASTHEWVPGSMWDLVVTMDDATNEHCSMFLCEEEGTWSSFRGVAETVRAKGLFCSLYTDRGSHYWTTPEAGGKVDKANPTQFGRALTRDLGIEMIAAYSPEARGRSERAFGTHQGRLPRELALAGVTDMAGANRYIREVYMPAFNKEFARPARESGSAFVPMADVERLDDILCEVHERTVGRDNCAGFGKLALQLPGDLGRPHYMKAKVKVRRHMDGRLSVWHGPRLLQRYSADGEPDGNSELREAA